MADLRSRVLSADGERLLAEARQLLGELREELARVPATEQDSAALASSIRQLDDFFLLVVVGEFNAGKSAFVNALLGSRILEEGVTPTTAQIQLVRHGDETARYADPSGIQIVTSPVDLLRDLHIVDTPGTNAIHRAHERLTADFVPRADLVLFVTSADRPFTETERAFMDAIRDWGKKIVIVVNKVDIFETAQELEQVVAFVREAGTRLLGVTPEVFPVSARLAWRAKQGAAEAWPASGFEPLERYVRDTLDEASRFRLKLANPIGVGDALSRRYERVASERLELLAADLEVLGDVDRQLRVHREDLANGFELRMTGVEKVLLEMESRGHEYFEDTLRVGRVFDLLNRSRIQQEFEQRVVGDAPAQIDRRVSGLIDWLVEQDFRQWQALSAKLAARHREHGDRILGGADTGSFHADRTRLLESVGRESRKVVETYDRHRESSAIADGARAAVAATAAIGAGAVGLGTAVTVAASTAAADITGMLAAGVLAAVGLLVIPAKRRRARAEMREKVTDLRTRLVGALRREFESSQERSAQRLADAIAPYSRFVRAEHARWDAVRTALTTWRGRAARLLGAVERFAPAS
ncbi:MAG TPA: dynamin family protein [Vicinamibacterales bacterium]|nr:dynamin family protein [Vicinamibacterales bacterium]